jgi:hypothetical protein
MAKQPRLPAPKSGPMAWPKQSLEDARRSGQLELFVLRSTRNPESAPVRQQRKRRRRLGGVW